MCYIAVCDSVSQCGITFTYMTHALYLPLVERIGSVHYSGLYVRGTRVVK